MHRPIDAFACRRSWLGRWLGGVLLGAVAGVGGAQPSRPTAVVVVTSTLERIAAVPTGTGGVEARIAAGTVASHADQLVYSVSFTNASGQVIDGVRVTSVIPADIRYLPGSASGPGGEILFSVDQGRTFGWPEELRVEGADGGARVADAADYTHVRWVLDAPLDAGATGIGRFLAVPR